MRCDAKEREERVGFALFGVIDSDTGALLFFRKYSKGRAC